MKMVICYKCHKAWKPSDLDEWLKILISSKDKVTGATRQTLKYICYDCTTKALESAK